MAFMIGPALGYKALKSAFNWFKSFGHTENVTGQTYEDDQYSDLRNADPYANFTYKMGPWEGLMQSMNFRTKFDKQKEELALASQAYQADIGQKEYDESYDSPAAQAARMRAAGQNPDLLGTSGVQSAASMQSEDNPMAAVASEDTLSDPAQFGSFIFSTITAAVGLSKDFKSLKAMQLANDAQQITNQGGMLQNVYEMILGFTPGIRDLDIGNESLDPEGNLVKTKLDPSSVESRIRENIKGSMSKRQQAQFMSLVANTIEGIPMETEKYKLWRERIEQRTGYFRSSTNPNYSEADELMYGASKILSDLAAEAEKLDLQNDVTEQNVRGERLVNDSEEQKVRDMHLTNQMDYEIAYDGSLAGASDNANNEYNIYQKGNAQIMEKAMNRMMSFLEEKANNGNRLASIALSLISLARLMNISAAGNVGGAKLRAGF